MLRGDDKPPHDEPPVDEHVDEDRDDQDGDGEQGRGWNEAEDRQDDEQGMEVNSNALLSPASVIDGGDNALGPFSVYLFSDKLQVCLHYCSGTRQSVCHFKSVNSERTSTNELLRVLDEASEFAYIAMHAVTDSLVRTRLFD